MYETEEQYKERMMSNAKAELIEHEAMLVLLESNRLACEINVAGLEIGVIKLKDVVPVIKSNIAEIQKFLDGEENEYE